MAVAQRFTITTIRGQASGRRTAYGAWGTAAGLASEAAEVSWAKMSPRDYLFGAVGSKPQQRRRTRLHVTGEASTRRSSASQANATSDPRGCHSRWLILSLVQTVAAPLALPARGPGGRLGRLTVPGRYAETVASPSSQKRQGYAAASPPGPLTPTRGPVRTTAPDEPVDGSRIGARTTKALPVAGVSIPFWSRPSASVLARRAGPLARSRSRTPFLGEPASSSPSTTSPARMSTPLATPTEPQTRFAHQCIPYVK